MQRMNEYSHKYFENHYCEYYPCHEGLDEINCLFCYCPLYRLSDCPGTPKYKQKDDRVIKVCTGCSFPHRRENYDQVLARLRQG